MDFDLLVWGSLRFPKTNFMNRCLIWLGLSQETGLPKKTRTPHVFHHFFLEIVHQCTMEHRGIIIVRYYIYVYIIFPISLIYIYICNINNFFPPVPTMGFLQQSRLLAGLVGVQPGMERTIKRSKGVFFLLRFL